MQKIAKLAISVWGGVFHPPVGDREREKNDLRTMKRILYDMGLLALVRCLLQRAFKFEPPFGPGSELKRARPPKN